MRWSIRSQLLAPLLTLLLMVVGMSVWTALASAQHARDQIETQVRQIVQTMRHAHFPLKENVLGLMKGFSGADYLLTDPTGHRITTLPVTDVELPDVVGLQEGQHLRLQDRVTVAGVPYLCAGLALEQGPNAGSTLYIFYPESLWRDALWQSARPSLVFGVLGGVAAIVLAVVLAQRLTRRLRELDRRTRLIAGGDFSPMPLPARNDELRDLGRSVNDMAERLAQYQESLRGNERLRLLGQVSGGLAHQLRNAVTGARLAVQVHAGECDGAGDGEALAVALRQLALVELHLKRFLDLGRQEPVRKAPCPLVELLEETLALLRPKCRHASIELHWQPPQDSEALVIDGDGQQLQHLFLNVVSNALEAAGPGGRVAVELAVDGGHCQVTVRDSGPGPAADVAGRMFELFVTGKPEGVGLGLAVARQIVEVHGGTIRWHRESDCTCFVIELPLEQSL